MSTDTTHLDALELRLSHERDRLAKAKTDPERTMREVWIAQIEREVSREQSRLAYVPDHHEMTDDELYTTLGEFDQ